MRLMKKSRSARQGLLLCVLLPACRLGAEGAINSWTSNGPEGGEISAIAINRLSPATLYVGPNGGGMYKSTNAGANWRAINTGLTMPFVRALAIDPATPTISHAPPATRQFASGSKREAIGHGSNGTRARSCSSLKTCSICRASFRQRFASKAAQWPCARSQQAQAK